MAYTGKDVYLSALSLLFEGCGEDADFKEHAPGLINLAMAEAFAYENAYRASVGDEELESPPVLTSLEDSIPYCDGICAVALPYGLAAYFWQDENDDYRSQDCRGRFIDALKSAAGGCEEDIQDVYGY